MCMITYVEVTVYDNTVVYIYFTDASDHLA